MPVRCPIECADAHRGCRLAFADIRQIAFRKIIDCENSEVFLANGVARGV
jgi:hypothetical protein